MVNDFLVQRAPKRFRLGQWLQALEVEVLEDIQTKLDMFLSNTGPDHAAEDLILAVDLLSCAEERCEVQLTDKQIHHRLLVWFQGGLMEKLRRRGVARMTGELSIDPAQTMPVDLDEQLTQQILQAGSAPRRKS